MIESSYLAYSVLDLLPWNAAESPSDRKLFSHRSGDSKTGICFSRPDFIARSLPCLADDCLLTLFYIWLL